MQKLTTRKLAAIASAAAGAYSLGINPMPALRRAGNFVFRPYNGTESPDFGQGQISVILITDSKTGKIRVEIRPVLRADAGHYYEGDIIAESSWMPKI